jgi:hypothetical protein
MNRGLRGCGWLGALAVCGGMLAGCVERRFVINTFPQGAVVYENGRPLGAAPADDHFTYYGSYQFTLVKDGYQTLKILQPVPAPWYQYPGLDFISENLIPWTIVDRREFGFTMEPMHIPNAGELLGQAQTLRGQGQAIGPPTPVPGAAPPPVPVPVPTPAGNP